MATYEIISKDYAKEMLSVQNSDGSSSLIEGDCIKNSEGKYVKTVLQVKFIRDDKVESEIQRYEVDGDDEDKIIEQLQATANEFNLRVL